MDPAVEPLFIDLFDRGASVEGEEIIEVAGLSPGTAGSQEAGASEFGFEVHVTPERLLQEADEIAAGRRRIHDAPS
jgi:hypothetical protein